MYQKSSFSESSMLLGKFCCVGATVPNPVGMPFTTRAGCWKLLLGAGNRGVLVVLKASARTCSFVLSVILKRFCSDRSRLAGHGSRIQGKRTGVTRRLYCGRA